MAESPVGKRVDAATSEVLIMSDWAINASIADSINDDPSGQAYVWVSPWGCFLGSRALPSRPLP
jgi:hypothetical protein